MEFFLELGVEKSSLRFRDHDANELSHYSKATTDIEFEFPFGWGELCGIADRGDYDLSCHKNHSKKNLEYFDSKTGEKFLPFCIEPSFGVDRACLAILCDAYDEDVIENAQVDEVRTVLKLAPSLAPIKACVLPLTKKLSESAFKIYKELSKNFVVDFDDVGSIGKRYRRQDEIGTPFCITFDFDSLQDGCVTVRDRDSMEQEGGRVSVDKLNQFLLERLHI